MGKVGTFDSWEIISDTTAIKHCDKSFFNYNGSGIPKGICWFFGADDLVPGGKIAITLQYQTKSYDARVINESTDRKRTRIFWGSELGSLFNQYRDAKFAATAFHRVSENVYRIEMANTSEELTAKASSASIPNAEGTSLQVQFKEWLSNKGSKYSYERVISYLVQTDEFCRKIKVIRKPLLQISDAATVNKALQAVSRDKIFRFNAKKEYVDIIAAIKLY